ncbi:GPR1/FUN34/yaaH [Pleurostoma richardsiae]|uniref:GPR1/FUN34/yaaH n=1 Tax=Pleurostoma richardsiae TaxID=41990 RepID=A0AA38VEH1_9PEZI|nr:GPR1/FUN34/yaaH [Pleurostoma richardsiae]
MSQAGSIQSKTAPDLEKQTTISPREQIALPYVPRNFANPAPLGLIAFATSIFLISLFGVQPRGVTEPNVLIGSMIFFGGIAQYIAGIMEFVAGNTFGATVFSAYASFNLAYALIFIPGSGIITAYQDTTTGELSPSFSQALALFVWAWFIVSVIFTIASTRSSWVLLWLLIFVDLTFILIAAGHMSGIEKLITAASGTGFVASFLAYYAGAAGLFANGTTAINLPVGSLRKDA